MATFSKVCSPLACSIQGSRINPPLPSPPPPRTRLALPGARLGWVKGEEAWLEGGEWTVALGVEQKKRDEQQATVRKESGRGHGGAEPALPRHLEPDLLRDRRLLWS